MEETGSERYRRERAAHRWQVPPRYNIAAYVCDAPRRALAMIDEDFDGAVRECTGARCNRCQARREPPRRPGREQGRSGGGLAADRRDRRHLLRYLEARGDLLSMSVLYGDEGIAHRLGDSEPRVVVTERRTCRASRPGPVPPYSCSIPTARARSSTVRRDRRHPRGRPGAALLHLRHHGPREGDRSRAPLPARARGVPLLPRRPEGERFHGMGEWAWAAGICPLLGPWRLGAVQLVLQRAAARPAPAALLPLPARGAQRVRDARRRSAR